MAIQQLMYQLKQEVVSKFLRGIREFVFHGLALRIAPAHDNEFQVLLPDGGEVFRVIDHGRSIEVLKA